MDIYDLERKINMSELEQAGIFDGLTEEEKSTAAQGSKASPIPKPASKAKTKKKPTKNVKESHEFPFNFAFGPQVLSAKVLEEKLGFKNGEKYTIDETKNKLAHAVFELQQPDASLLYLKEKNTFILTNVLKQKGATQIACSSIRKAEKQFLETYLSLGTEERALIYKNINTGEEKVIFPDVKKSPTFLNGAPAMYYRNDLDWPLVADLHSHHLLGGTPSEIDNKNEQIRFVLFGIAYWEGAGDRIFWNFREWTGQGYQRVHMLKAVDLCA